jgi:hypothetical protein
MTSRVFKARTGHTPSNPQLCGLTGAEIQKDDRCLYLVCHGAKARPDYQVRLVDEVEYEDSRGATRKRKVFESGMTGQPMFSVWTGEWETYTKANGKKGRRRVYEWQTEGSDGRRYPVECWSNMVHLSAAETLGYDIPRNKDDEILTTNARKGDRTKGVEHRVSKDAESPLVTLAKAALDDEEAGLVAPKEEHVSEADVDEIIRLLGGA